MVDLLKVSKTYPPDIQALTDITLSVNSGEMLFLTGTSGAGKTTLLHLLCRLEKPSRGIVEVMGRDLATLSRRKLQRLRQRIGVAYQDFKLLPEQSVARNIAIPMEVAFQKASVIRNRISSLLEHLGLADKMNTKAGELSRGEQQRVALARALANDPALVLADEPTGNLDFHTSDMVMDLLERHNDRGTTIIIATHDRSIYQDTDHRIVCLEAGTLHA